MGVIEAVILWLAVMAVVAVIRIIWDYVGKRRESDDRERDASETE